MAKQIVSKLGVLSGEWCFEGTRIPADFIGILLFRGIPYASVLGDYPELDEEDLDAARLRLPFEKKWATTGKIIPWGKRWKLRTIWLLDTFEDKVIRHRFYWLCHLIASSKWWTTW